MTKNIVVLLMLVLFPVSLSQGFSLDLGKVLEFGKNISKASKSFSEEERYYIGRASGARLLVDHQLLNQKQLQHYVSAIGQTLAMASARPELYAGYHFIVLNEPERVNAYAVPGGFIFITTGLIAKAVNEDELAAVLAHEVAHLVLDHPINSIKKQYTDQLLKDALSEASKEFISEDVLMLANLAGGLDKLSGMLVDHAAQGYSRSKEKEADLEAIHILRTAGYDPLYFPQVLAKLSGIGTGQSGTHGDPLKRAEAITKKLSNDKPLDIQKRGDRFRRVMAKL
ncbi:MAG: M48 family metallopeptidase [Mariprofundaceae bacterium]|nr:M48 family metallopeptidase [Mariprofundaceae bacterium]